MQVLTQFIQGNENSFGHLISNMFKYHKCAVNICVYYLFSTLVWVIRVGSISIVIELPMAHFIGVRSDLHFTAKAVKL